MLDVNALKARDLKGLSKSAVTELAAALLAQLAAKDEAIAAKDAHIARREREIKFKDAKIERITFDLARLKAWKFGARTEAMNAQQRQMFEDTLAEDEADLQAQLAALKALDEQDRLPAQDNKRRPRRQALPEHLRRVEHHHEPENTTCPTPQCGQAMVRIGEDVSERLDIVPAEFFVHRHIRGKWVCKCCQQTGEGRLVQEPVEPLFEAHCKFVLSAAVLHADETPVRMLDPGAGKTAKAYVWAYARGEHDGTPGVIYDFCTGRGSKYPADFLAEWAGTLTCDDYAGYDVVFRREGCIEAGCLAHARRKFDELARANASPVAAQAVARIARLYKLESQAREMTPARRLAHRQQYARPLWDELHAWMKQERARGKRLGMPP